MHANGAGRNLYAIFAPGQFLIFPHTACIDIPSGIHAVVKIPLPWYSQMIKHVEYSHAGLCCGKVVQY